MNCQEFQEVLPHIIDEAGHSEGEAHLRTCAACAGLTSDLRQIADKASLMLPLHDPSPRVWSNIQQSLVSEGLIRPSRTGQIANFPVQSQGWTMIGSALAAAVLVLAVVLVRYHPAAVDANQRAAGNGPASEQTASDAQMMSQIDPGDPAVRKAFEDNLKQVNSYIADAEKAVHDDQDDADAQEHLRDAYQQKAMLYEMATARSTE